MKKGEDCINLVYIMQNKLVVGAGEEGCCWGKNEGAGDKMEKGGWGKGVNYIKNRVKCLKFASSD